MPGTRAADPPSPEALRAWRIRRSYSPPELATMAGISIQHYRRLESDDPVALRRPSPKVVRSIASVLNITVEELRAGPPSRPASVDRPEPVLIG